MKKYRHSPLLNEAIEITNDLGNNDVTFIGATAVFLHTNVPRASQDLDFIIDITDEQLLEKGYIKYTNRKNGYSTPRGNLIVDIYKNMDEDIGGIPTKTIVDTAEEFEINAKRSRINKVKAANLEVLIVMKFNAGRNQDIDDLETLTSRSRRQIDWEYLKGSLLDYDGFQYNQIRRIALLAQE